MNNKLLAFVALLLCANVAKSEDAGQLVFDAIENQQELENDIKGVTSKDEAQGFYPGSADEQLEFSKDNVPDHFLPMKSTDITEPSEYDVARDKGQRIIGDPSINSDRLIEANDRELFKSVANKHKEAFSFYYVRDEYDVKDPGGVYDRTYKNSPGALRGGSLMLSWERALVNSWVNISWGANIGVGLSQGKGQFIDGTLSDTEFSLWSIPVELGLTLELPVSSWFDLAVEAGPGVLGLYQVRSDFEDGAKGKRRRQVGTGYFAEAKFKLSLANMFRKTAFTFFSEYGVSNMTLDLIVRTQDYGNFQDDITISGQSLGIGFTFDYL